MAEMRRRFMQPMFNLTREVCRLTLTPLFAGVRVRESNDLRSWCRGRRSDCDIQTDLEPGSRMAGAVVNAWIGPQARAEPGGAFGRRRERLQRVTHRTGGCGNSGGFSSI